MSLNIHGSVNLTKDYIKENIVTSGLILNLDAGQVGSYPGSGTNWYDLSGNNNTSILVNEPTFSSVNGGSIVFNGSDQYANTFDASSLTDMTIEMWIYDTRNSSTNQIDILSYNGNAGSYTFGGTHFFRTDGTGVAGRRFIASGGPPVNTWYRFCYVKNGDLYINETLYTGTGTDRPYGIISLANTRTNVTSRLNGRIGAVKIYNRTLSAAEITQNFNSLRYRYSI